MLQAGPSQRHRHPNEVSFARQLASLRERRCHPRQDVLRGADDDAIAFFNDGLEHPRAARAATGTTSPGHPGQPRTDARADPPAELAGSGIEADQVLLDLAWNAGILLTHPTIMNIASGCPPRPAAPGIELRIPSSLPGAIRLESPHRSQPSHIPRATARS